MLAKPSRGLGDSVLGTFPPDGPEDEAQDGGSHTWAPEPELAGEASPQPSGLPVTSWCGTLEEGSAKPRAWRGPVWPSGRVIGMHGEQPDDLNCQSDQMAGPRGLKGSPGALASGDQRTRTGAPTRGPARALAWAPELEPEGEASPARQTPRTLGERQAG
ncbi:hypothetical protein NDU88_007859 [Pleurodeles waltl]|uniref:Uncharacterized protein n=1 Tax=Pleurodeles waltl TaxID=8319 RepID=A0AAV7NYL7_PLEWA|nr:hypothetical protein NDU88_007859 [Pleurodeles waltl]